MDIETTILIPSFNGKQLLEECLSSLRGQTYQKFKTVFIDNNSRDGSVQYVKNNFPEVDILRFEKNLGFAEAINEGIRYSLRKYAPKYIALLNNDTKAKKGWLRYLIETVESEKRVAAATSHMFSYDDPDTIDSQGGVCTISGDCYSVNMARKKSEVTDIPKQVLFPAGGAMLLKTHLLKNIGLFDGRYFAYCEDLDWGWRATLYGYKIKFAENAEILHRGSATTGKSPLKKEYLGKRNALCTILKNYRPKALLRASKLLLWNYITSPLAVLLDKETSLKKWLTLSIIQLLSLGWNLKNLKETLRLRHIVQSKRILSDREIITLMIKNG